VSKITLKNILKGFFVIIPVFVLGEPAFSLTKLFPPPVVPKAQFAVHRESLKTIVALTSTSETDAVHKINIMINNEPLVDVLQRIAEETNISFRVPSDLFSKRISASIHVSNWDEGVNELLKNMSRLSVWDKNSHLTQVSILSERSSSNIQNEKASSRGLPKANSKNRASFGSTEASLQHLDQPSESNLKKLLHIHPGGTLPGELFNDPDVNQFLKSNGIQSPKDWKEFHKARIVHKAVRKQLRQILAKK
jgi:hypothetical protein